MITPRDQIAYIPDHADGDVAHEDVEFGFVTSVKGDVVFCRYWRTPDDYPWVSISLKDLRTRSNSEGTPRRNIIRYDAAPPGVVSRAYDIFVKED